MLPSAASDAGGLSGSRSEKISVVDFIAGPALISLVAPVVWWLGSALFAAYVAGQKGYNGMMWFVVAVPFGPVALLAAAGLPAREPREVPTIADGALIEQPNRRLFLVVDGELRGVPRGERQGLQTMSYAGRLEWFEWLQKRNQ